MTFNIAISLACNCNTSGSNGIACNTARQCSCRGNIKGLTCNSCKDNYVGFPACKSCQCDPQGSVNLNCNTNGRCSCKSGYAGDKCNQCASGYFKRSGRCTGNVTFLFFLKKMIDPETLPYH